MKTVRGTVTSGLGQGAHFMAVAWVRDEVRRLTGFVPYPGTLNVRLEPEALEAWREIEAGQSVALTPPSPDQCGGRLVPVVVVPDVEAGVVVPDLTHHGKNLLELIAPVHLRDLLGLRDGDVLTLRVRSARS